MSQGVMMFAHNNEQVDYGLIALCGARMIRHNLKSRPRICLVTDQGTLLWLKRSQGEDIVSQSFDDIIVQDVRSTQTKRFLDTYSTSHSLPWNNGGRSSAYDISPYEETLLIDCDYLVMDQTLDHVWGSRNSMMMNHHVTYLDRRTPSDKEVRLDLYGIPLYWATCVYFKRDQQSKDFFDLVDAVKDEPSFYQWLFRYPGGLFRNDYAFSVAAHIMGGYREAAMPSLPSRTLLTSLDSDDIASVNGLNDITFLVADEQARYQFRANRVRGTNVHVMNKFAITRQASRILEVYRDA